MTRTKELIIAASIIVVAAALMLCWRSPLPKGIAWSGLEAHAHEEYEALLERARTHEVATVEYVKNIFEQAYGEQQIIVLIGGIALGIAIGILIGVRKR